MKKVLFVCLGNICRSPTAEAIFRGLVEQENLQDKITCDSAGTSNYNEGKKSDPRTIAAAKKRNYTLTNISRPIVFPDDFQNHDYIVTMDNSNYENVLSLDQDEKYSNKVYKMQSFSVKKDFDEVPDPYLHGEEQFDLVLDILEESCKEFLKFVKTN